MFAISGKYFLSSLVLFTVTSPAVAEWPLFENGNCRVGLIYTGEQIINLNKAGHLMPAKASEQMKRDPANCWVCRRSEIGGRNRLELEKACSDELEPWEADRVGVWHCGPDSAGWTPDCKKKDPETVINRNSPSDTGNI